MSLTAAKEPSLHLQTVISQRYVRTTDKANVRISRQNEHIACEFERCNDALIELVRRSITVIRVVIDGKAKIYVMDSQQARALPGCVINSAGDGTFVRTATIHNCHVIWETRDDK